MFPTDPIVMHYNEAAQLTNNMFSKAPQQPCAEVFVHLWACGLSKTEVLIASVCVGVCVCVLYARNGSLYHETEWPAHNYRRSSSLSINSPPPVFSFPFCSREDKENEDVVQIIAEPCFDALPPLLLLLFKHEPFLFSLLLLTTAPEFDMQVLPPSFSLSHI